MLRFLTISLLCIHSIACANDQPLQGVAVRALKEAFNLPNGQLWEHGGIIFARDGQYLYTSPAISDGKNDSVLVRPKFLKAESDVLLGSFHTHPCLPRSHFPQYFSMPDIALSLYRKIPEFILDECTGLVHMFDPAIDDPEASEVVIDGTKHLVPGRIIGNIGQIGVNLDNEVSTH